MICFNMHYTDRLIKEAIEYDYSDAYASSR